MFSQLNFSHRNLSGISSQKWSGLRCELVILQDGFNVIVFMGVIGWTWSGSLYKSMLSRINCIEIIYNILSMLPMFCWNWTSSIYFRTVGSGWMLMTMLAYQRVSFPISWCHFCFWYMLGFVLINSLTDVRRLKCRATCHAFVCNAIFHSTSIIDNHIMFTNGGIWKDVDLKRA